MVKKATLAFLALLWLAVVVAVLLFGPIRGPVCDVDQVVGEAVCHDQGFGNGITTARAS